MMKTNLPQVAPNFSNVTVCCRIRKPRQSELYDIQVTTKPNDVSCSSTKSQRKSSNGSRILKSPSSQLLNQPLRCSQQRNTSRSRSSSVKKGLSSAMTPKRGHSVTQKFSSQIQNFQYSIFSPAEESPFVLASEDQPIKGKTLQAFLVSQNDIQQFSEEQITEGQAQLYSFDKVLNDSYSQQSLYSRLARMELHSAVKSKIESNLCFISFGPSDPSEKSKKTSQLLSTSSEGSNIALKAINDILTIQETVLKERHQQVRVSILQIYNNELSDLLVVDNNKCGKKISLACRPGANEQFQIENATTKVIRTLQDYCQVLRVAQGNREIAAQQNKLESHEMRRNSHLVVRMTTSKNNIDFVELCGSELAATSLNNHVVGRQVALQKKFVTQSFNSLSCALISSAIDQEMNKEQHSVLTKVLSTSLFAPSTKVILTCTVSPSQHQFRHSVTALKFASKIREVISKRQLKASKHLENMESELHHMSCKVSQQCQQTDKQETNKKLLSKFSTLRQKYQQCLNNIKKSGSFGTLLKNQAQQEELKQIKREFDLLKDEFNIFEMNHLNQKSEANKDLDILLDSDDQFISKTFDQNTHQNYQSLKQPVVNKKHPTKPSSAKPKSHTKQKAAVMDHRIPTPEFKLSKQNKLSEQLSDNSQTSEPLNTQGDQSWQIEEEDNTSLNITQSVSPQRQINNSFSGQRLTQESQKLLQKYREAKLQKQQQVNQSNGSSLPPHCVGVNHSQKTSSLTEPSMVNTSMAEDDVRMNRLHQEIYFLQQKLDEKTQETETLKNTLNGSSQVFPKKKPCSESPQGHVNSKQVGAKLDERNEQIAQMLKQKQTDQKEIKELKFKLERESKHNSQITIENEQLKIKTEQLQQRFVDQEAQIDRLRSEVKQRHLREQEFTQFTEREKEERSKLGSHLQDMASMSNRQVQQNEDLKSNLYDLKLNHEALKRQHSKTESQNNELLAQKEEFEKAIQEKEERVQYLEQELTKIKAKEYDNVDVIRKSSDSQHSTEQAIKEKKKAEEDLYLMRDKLRVVLDEKIQLENELNHIERVEESRINDLEQKFSVLSQEYTCLYEENQQLKRKEHEAKVEFQALVKGRDSFKDQFLELREINKDLKQKFVSIENQVKAYLSEENQTKEAEKENLKQESKKKAVILEDIQGLIKDYKKNATEKKSRHIFNPIIEDFKYEQ